MHSPGQCVMGESVTERDLASKCPRPGVNQPRWRNPAACGFGEGVRTGRLSVQRKSGALRVHGCIRHAPVQSGTAQQLSSSLFVAALGPPEPKYAGLVLRCHAAVRYVSGAAPPVMQAPAGGLLTLGPGWQLSASDFPEFAPLRPDRAGP